MKMIVPNIDRPTKEAEPGRDVEDRAAWKSVSGMIGSAARRSHHTPNAPECDHARYAKR